MISILILVSNLGFHQTEFLVSFSSNCSKMLLLGGCKLFAAVEDTLGGYLLGSDRKLLQMSETQRQKVKISSLLNGSGSGISEIRAPLGWAKSEMSGGGPEIQHIYGLGVFQKLEDGLWPFKESFSHVTSGIRILEGQEGILGFLLSTLHPLISWTRNTEAQRNEAMCL